jgi:hypothetical protein
VFPKWQKARDGLKIRQLIFRPENEKENLAAILMHRVALREF